MFCAIATTIDRCKTESVVDVFQVVKAQRIQKPGLVLTLVRDKTNLLYNIAFYNNHRTSIVLCLKLCCHFLTALKLTQTSVKALLGSKIVMQEDMEDSQFLTEYFTVVVSAQYMYKE